MKIANVNNAKSIVRMERDRRGLHLAAGGAILSLLAFIAGLAASASSNWASFTGSMSGYFGPWSVCEDGKYGYDLCHSVSSRLRPSWAIRVSGAGSIGCTILLGLAAFLAPLIVAMHITSKKTLVKFRHATLGKMVCTAAGALCGFVSIIFFVLEVFIFRVGQQSGLFVDLSWAFYLQLIAVGIAVVSGAGAGIEFGWSRKLGGDPTVYNRDPEGTAATTIANPNFKENGHANHTNRSSVRNSSSRGRGHRHTNGVAMTHMSGLPYMVTANGNGHIGNSRSNGGIAFDPNKTPLRSSLKRSKPPTEDATDTSMGIQNLAFTQSSPPSKKKVRIHTHSTPV